MAQTDTNQIRAIARWPPKSDASAGLSKQQAEMVELTAVDAVARLCAGRITATEYAEALLAQIDTHRCLNTFASLDAAKVIEMCLHAQSQVSRVITCRLPILVSQAVRFCCSSQCQHC